MTDIDTETTMRTTPVHLWIVGAVSLLWNSFGSYDYTMTETRNAAHLARFPPGMIAYIDAASPLFIAAWALGVWGALAGSVLLLMRSRFAVIAFAVSLAGLALTTVYEYGLQPMPAAMRGPGMIGLSLSIWAVAIGLLLYARAMRMRGVLR